MQTRANKKPGPKGTTTTPQPRPELPLPTSTRRRRCRKYRVEKRASRRARGRTRVPQAVSLLTRTAPKKGALPGPWVGEGSGLGGAGRRDRTPRPGRTPGCRWLGEPREKFNPRLYHFHDSEMGVQQGHPTPLHGRKFRPRSIGEKKGKTYSNSIINIKNQAIADAGATKTFVLTGTPVNNVQ